ncbi:MAG: 3-hydroxyacyl-CoA dehydrogenase family protein [Gemmatimonadaceae bacterium]
MSGKTVAIVGAGTMGQGIAYAAAAAGYAVAITDASADSLTRAMDAIRSAVRGGLERGKLSQEEHDDVLERISAHASLGDAVGESSIVIEAVPEILAVKRAVFAKIEAGAGEATVLATNTSSLSISEISRDVSRPERVVGMHFFNPVHAMKLVEVVRGKETSAATIARAKSFAAALGKTPIVVEDTPGFATSRLGVVLGLEAMRMLEQGVASAEDIDTAMRLGYNHPVGPLRLSDIVGLDVRLAIADHLHATLGGDTYRAPDVLRRMVSEGRLGRKSGEGFYRWTEEES